MRLLVIDTTHGGDLLAVEYAERGHDVTCVDCYGTTSSERKSELGEMGIRVLGESPNERFDLMVSPIHCPESFVGGAECDERSSFHQAVGELASFRGMTFEVTGVWGKTTTCHLIAHILRHFSRRVVQVSTRGIHILERDTDTIDERVSTSPTTILRVAKLDQEFDNGVFEVSLGGTGLADVAILTTLGNNYTIAAGTRTAFDGKKQLVRTARKVLVVPEEERELWEPHVPPGIWMTTFGEQGTVSAQVRRHLRLGEEVEVEFGCFPSGHFSARLGGDFLVPAYLGPMAASISALKSCGIPVPQLCQALGDFTGVRGRGEVRREGGMWVVRDRHPNVSAHTVEFEVSILEEYYDAQDIGLVIEPGTQGKGDRISWEDMDLIFEVHDSIRGAYVLDRHGRGGHIGNYAPIQDIEETMDRHSIVLWCTKERYV